MVFIYTTCSDEVGARSLSAQIIEKNLAASINIWRIGAIYRFEGAFKEEKEVAVLINTSESKVQEIEDLILENHTNSIPFVGVLDARRINRGYKEWMSQIVQ